MFQYFQACGQGIACNSATMASYANSTNPVDNGWTSEEEAAYSTIADTGGGGAVDYIDARTALSMGMLVDGFPCRGTVGAMRELVTNFLRDDVPTVA